MLKQELLISRAFTYACEQFGISKTEYEYLEEGVKDKVYEVVELVAEDMKWNQLKYFRPLPYQEKFFNITAPRKALIAANRTGKSVASAVELSYHLTGEYPPWWKGRVYKSSIVAMVCGESWSQLSKVAQYHLFGVFSMKNFRELGSGYIPKHCIDLSLITIDGANCLTIAIKHSSGDYSTLFFSNYRQSPDTLQGFNLDVLVVDEQPPDGFYGEAITRTANTNGIMLGSFTPLKGQTQLVNSFWSGVEDHEFINVTWDDMPYVDPWGHNLFSAEARKTLIAGYSPHEIDARTKGIPSLGMGSIFKVLDWPTYENGEHDFDKLNLNRLISLDLGAIKDPTVISFLFYDKFKDIIYLDSQLTLRNNATAIDNIISTLLRPKCLGTPVLLPADGKQVGRYTQSAMSVHQALKEANINVIEDSVPALMHKQSPPISNHKSYGLAEMQNRINSGRFFINKDCKDFLSEARNLHVRENGCYEGKDDHVDSARYGVLGCQVGEAKPSSYIKGQEYEFARLVAKQRKADRANRAPEWKQPVRI